MAQVDEKLKRSRAGQTQEETNSLTGEAGLYRHPEAKNEDGSAREVVCLYDPLFGNAQAEAAIRVGFERVSDVPEGYVKTVTGLGEANNAAAAVNADKTVGQEDLKGLQARMSAHEEKQKALEDENSQLRAKLDAKQDVAGGEQTKVDAASVTAVRQDPSALAGAPAAPAELGSATTGDSTPDETDEEREAREKAEADEAAAAKQKADEEEAARLKAEEEAAKGKPLSAQNKTELLETATNEGVELTPELDTNDKIRDAIQAKRDAAAKESEN